LHGGEGGRVCEGGKGVQGCPPGACDEQSGKLRPEGVPLK